MRILFLFALVLSFVNCGSAQTEKKTVLLKQKIAKMLIVGFDGTEYNENSKVVKDIKDAKVGGVILFERNITPVDKNKNSIAILSDMCLKFQQLREDNLMIAIDQEGGRVTRLKHKYGFPKFVSAKWLGDLNNLDTTRYYAELTSKWMNNLNINTNFAPCVDIISNENCPVIAKLDRAYSKDEKSVIHHANEVIEQSSKRGIFTSLKHFPGHGSSTVDSHKGFTDITDSWTKRELVPFVELMKSSSCSMIMAGHLFNRNIDSLYPATLSRATLTDFLRKELGWNGVIVTDDMLMGAITNNYGFEQGVLLAINAGCDMFIYSGNIRGIKTPITELFINTVKNFVDEGKISVDRINESYDRIDKMLNSEPLA